MKKVMNQTIGLSLIYSMTVLLIGIFLKIFFSSIGIIVTLPIAWIIFAVLIRKYPKILSRNGYLTNAFFGVVFIISVLYSLFTGFLIKNDFQYLGIVPLMSFFLIWIVPPKK